MLKAMQQEIKLTANTVSNNIINTIYFGGGTPSLLNPDEIKTLLQETERTCNVDKDAEITMEVNPDDINQYNLRNWKAIGINRLSIGVQSFKQPDLEWMNRAHSAKQALQSIILIKSEGFTNYSVDLIYGTPTLQDDEWVNNIETVIALGVPHLSCYALTVEPLTPLKKRITQNKKEDVDPEKQARHFLILMSMLSNAGYQHYEISNFALPGYRSRHNSGYWQGKTYIGIGPSAHSYYNNTRRWNVTNNAIYIKSLQNNIIPFEQEDLTVTQQLNEYIMTSLRTLEGLNLDFVKNKYGEDKSLLLEKQSRRFAVNGKLQKVEENIILTNEGKLFADGIAADLFFN
jgi:oxygen-independent coproporphyrinogen-3 oxidase